MAIGKCIICGIDSDGVLVADTKIIQFIRAVKQKLNMAQNNTLVVCPACSSVHADKRKKFEGKWALYVVLAAVVFAVLVFLPLAGGVFSLQSLIFAPLLSIFIAALALTDYMPPIEGQSITAKMNLPSFAPPVFKPSLGAPSASKPQHKPDNKKSKAAAQKPRKK